LRYAHTVSGIAQAHGIDNAVTKTVESNAFALSLVTLVVLAMEAVQARNEV
jgi:hypothetical protein